MYIWLLVILAPLVIYSEGESTAFLSRLVRVNDLLCFTSTSPRLKCESVHRSKFRRIQCKLISLKQLHVISDDLSDHNRKALILLVIDRTVDDLTWVDVITKKSITTLAFAVTPSTNFTYRYIPLKLDFYYLQWLMSVFATVNFNLGLTLISF